MEISLERPLLDFLVKLVNPADPNPSRICGPPLGPPWAVPTLWYAAQGRGIGGGGRHPFLLDLGSNKGGCYLETLIPSWPPPLADLGHAMRMPWGYFRQGKSPLRGPAMHIRVWGYFPYKRACILSARDNID